MKKKGIVFLLCLALLAAGCGAGSGEAGRGPGKYKKFITIDVYDEFSNYQGLQGGWFAKAVKDRFNMELNIIAPNVAGGGDTLFQTRSAAGNLGDLIIVNTANGKFDDLVNAGLILDCEKLVRDKAVMKNYGDAVARANDLVEKDGIYCFPNSISTQAATEAADWAAPTFGPYIRWDYYKALGYPVMRNLEDFLDVLEDMQRLAREEEGCDDIYAISLFNTWDDNMMNNAKQLACMYGYDEQGFVLSKADGSDYQSVIDESSVYVSALRFLSRANARGLVDPDSAMQNYDMWASKYQGGKVLYAPWPWVGPGLYDHAEYKAAGKGFMMAPVMDMRIFAFGCCPEGDATRVMAVGAGTEDPQRLVDFIDWLYSPEGVEMNCQTNGAQGPEGLTWEMGEDGRPVLTEFGKAALPDNPVEVPEEYGGGKWSSGVSALNFKTVNQEEIDPNAGEPYNYLCWETTLEGDRPSLEKDWSERMKARTVMEYLENQGMLLIAPGSGYSTPRENANITTVRAQCKTAVVNGSWELVFAPEEDFDAILREMQTTVRGLGYDDVYAVDLKNARDQNEARKASAERFSGEEQVKDTQKEAPPGKSR